MTTHEFDRSGVDGEGRYVWRCTCGWETSPAERVQAAAQALEAHLDEITDQMKVVRLDDIREDISSSDAPH